MSKLNIISCINGYPPSQSVINYGSWIAKLMNQKLKLFHTIDHQYHENTSDLSGSIGLGAREEMLEEIVNIEHEQNKLIQKKSQLIMDSAVSQAKDLGHKDVIACLRKGRLLDNLLDFSDDLSLCVIGKYGKRHGGASKNKPTVGHKVEAVVKNLKRPVLIVSEDFKKPSNILLAYDGSEGAKKVLNFIKSQLAGSQLAVKIVYLGEENDKSSAIVMNAQNQLKNSQFNVSTQIIDKNPQDALTELLKEDPSQILAMGAFGHGLLHDLFIGSLTSKMIQVSNNPLLLVR